jgi:hypothetical protein
LAACEDDAVEPDVSERFTATLIGANEIPPKTTTATGSAVFELNRAGTELRYTLTINNITGLRQAHIHTGTATENGPVVVYLFGPHAATPGITVPGTLVKMGVITAADVDPATFTGSFSGLLARLRAGTAFVNAHTGVNAGGEIRGQTAVSN